MTKGTIIILLLFVLFRSYAQDKRVELLNLYAKSKPDTAGVELLLRLSSHFVFAPLELKRELDSALLFANEASQLSEKLNYARGKEEAAFWIGMAYIEAKDYSPLRLLLKTVSDTIRIKLMLQVAGYKFNTRGNTKVDFDTAGYYASQALAESRKIHSAGFEIQAIEYLVRYYAEKKDKEAVKPYLTWAFATCRKSGYTRPVAMIHLYVLTHFGYDKEIYEPFGYLWKSELAKCQNAVERKNMQGVEAKMLELISDGYIPADIIATGVDNGEGTFLRVLELLGKTAEENPVCYATLCYIYYFRGDFSKSLSYGLKVEALTSKGIIDKFTLIATNAIGDIYYQRGNLDESINYFKKSLAVARQLKVTPRGITYKYLTRSLAANKKPTEALAALDDSKKDSALFDEFDRKEIVESRGTVYYEMGDYKNAERYLLQSRELAKDMTISDRLTVDYELGKLYVATGEFDKAVRHLEVLNRRENMQYGGLFGRAELAYLLFRVDSARGDYQTAITHLQEHKLLRDSMFNEAKNKQLEELKVQYETDQKDKDIQLTTLALRRTDLIKNILIAGALLFLLLLAAIYFRYRKNQQVNKLLQSQQNSLQLLNQQQSKLLDEKDWLVKEIHHRVKNNLQIVMSLLNSQSAYIDNDAALTAIHDSQHRVHAMSLIHQKLYNSENLSTINMPLYIRELIAYLKDSFDAGKRIRIDLNIEPVELDVSRAVPLGLILNEAITNSLKYAFPNINAGVIAISLIATKSNHYLLTIADNGIGIQSELKKTGSLGMSLMKGLTEDIGGSFDLKNINGTEINIAFEHDPGFKEQHGLAALVVSNN